MTQRGNNNRSRKKSQLVKEAEWNKKALKKQAQKLYKERIKEMRKYSKQLRKVDLRHNLTAQQKRAATLLWNEYTELTTRPIKVYRPRNKARLKEAKKYTGGKSKAFDVAFIPSADPNAKVRVDKDGLSIEHKFGTETTILFNMKRMATDPESEIQRAIKRFPDARQFLVMAGRYLWNGGIHPDLLETKIIELMGMYADPRGYNNGKNTGTNYWGNWLFGVKAFRTANQKAVNEYRSEYHKKVRAIKTKKRSIRRKEAVIYGKK